jgi:hypothetical protein
MHPGGKLAPGEASVDTQVVPCDEPAGHAESAGELLERRHSGVRLPVGTASRLSIVKVLLDARAERGCAATGGHSAEGNGLIVSASPLCRASP